MTTLIELVLDVLERRNEIEGENLLVTISKIASDYFAQRGEPAIEWIKNEIRTKNGTWKVYDVLIDGGKVPLGETEIDNIIKHITKGHLDNVYELLWADLVFKGYECYQAESKASLVAAHLTRLFIMAHGAGDKAETGSLIDLSEKDSSGLGKISSLRFKKKRITCPHCYRVIKEWDSSKTGYDFGPKQIKCKACKNILPTFLIPWNKTTFEQKRKKFTFPAIMMIGGLILTFAGADDNSFWIFAAGGLLWILDTWRQGQVSLKTPTW